MTTSRVYVAVPAYGGVEPEALPGLMLPSRDHEYGVFVRGSSLLADCFNRHLCDAVNAGEYTHFAMHHADIEAPFWWLDSLMTALDEEGADVASAVVPIKDNRGVTSGGWMDPTTGLVRRITMTEYDDLPTVFDASESPDAGRYLAVNTGLWVARLGVWVREFPGFEIRTRIGRHEDGRLVAQNTPEDWGFSRWAAVHGLKAVGVKLPLGHWGRKRYGTEHAWGSWEVDQAALPPAGDTT